ncbi:MAG: ankyrin repeat domain-containing protein [Flavobacterium sp.]|jgi:ankyrin repeat protein|nr:ankyrin repeat domain-containing protein [Pyrinomonadaceae bacterium]MCU0351071.1 ankyrin repeat domain-containing protein [Flavobacterium sp.]
MEATKTNIELKHFFTLIGAVMIGKADVVLKMLDLGININSSLNQLKGFEKGNDKAMVSEYDTPLLVAIKHNKNLVNLLIENGADVTIEDENGKTPIMIAQEKGLEDIVTLLNEKLRTKSRR